MTGKRLFRRAFTSSGAAPGVFSIPAGSPKPRIHVMRYSPERMEEEVYTEVEPGLAKWAPDEVLWVDVQGLGDESLLRRLADMFQLHPLALADVANLGQRPKVDDYDDTIFCVLRMVTIGSSWELNWEQISIFTGAGFVLTFQERPGDCLEPLRQRIRGGRPMIRGSGSDYLATMIIDAIVDGYFPVLEAYGEWLEHLELRVMSDPQQRVLSDIYRAKRELLQFRRAAWPLRDTLGRVLRDRRAHFTENTLLYLRDTLDHVMQVVDVIESYREVSGSFLEVYLSSVSHRTNEVMRVLTVFASIFIPLTFLAGIYGMNFDASSPYNLPELGWRYGYPVFLGVCLLIGVALLIMFFRLGWLRRDQVSGKADVSRPAPPSQED